LERELAEELGIECAPGSFTPIAFAESGGGDVPPHLVILLYMITVWNGHPQALEGGEVGWFTPEEVLALSKPPLDVSLARQLFRNHVSAANGPCQD
jgi:8-oxo-dGTP diphosphatase